MWKVNKRSFFRQAFARRRFNTWRRFCVNAYRIVQKSVDVLTNTTQHSTTQILARCATVRLLHVLPFRCCSKLCLREAPRKRNAKFIKSIFSCEPLSTAKKTSALSETALLVCWQNPGVLLLLLLRCSVV